MRLNEARPVDKIAEKPDPVDFDDPQQVAMLAWLCKQETPEGLSAMARHICNHDYWKIESEHSQRATLFRHGLFRSGGRAVFRTCGFVDWGPHRKMAAGMLSTRDTVILVSRDGLKTSGAIARLLQLIVRNRNVRILISMVTEQAAAESVLAIRTIIESDTFKKVFGDYRGKSANWQKNSFTVCDIDRDPRMPTVMAAGSASATTGYHFDVWWVDDPVTQQIAESPEQIEKQKRFWRQMQPLKDPGCWELHTLTPYVNNDFAEMLIGEQRDSFDFTIIPCGVHAYYDEQGKVQTRGTPEFRHLTRGYLQRIANRMQPRLFNRQYGLSFEEDEGSVFARENFLSASWEERFGNLNAYILTDTAGSESVNACMSCMALALIDHDDTAYIADMIVGRWKPSDLIANFWNFYEMWAPKVTLYGVAMERITLNLAYRNTLDNEAHRRGIALSYRELPRGTAQHEAQGQSKQKRILGLEGRLRSGRLRILDTMRRYVHLDGQTLLLWDPKGHRTPDGKDLPAGEIVKQFVNWRSNPKYRGVQDIPDALAALNEMDNTGHRLIVPTAKLRASKQLGPARASDRYRRRPDFWGMLSERTRRRTT